MIELPTDENPVTVVEGDCLDVLRQLPDASVSAVITDPPYSERTHKGHDAAADSPVRGSSKDGARRKSLGYSPWSEMDVWRFVPELCRVSSGWVCVMTDHTLAPLIGRCMEQCGRYVFAPLPFYLPGSRVRLTGDGPSSWTDWIIVARTPKQRDWGTLPGGYGGTGPGWWDKEHMGGKPSALMRELVKDYAREGDIVLDPFAGSGTTAIAALHEGRRCVAIEKDPTYCQLIRRRVKEATDDGLFAAVTREQPGLFDNSEGA